MGFGIGVNLGPGTRARSRARLDPADPERLIVEIPASTGARLFGAVLLALATVGLTEALRGEGSWAGAIFAALVAVSGAALSFFRRRLILDRRAGLVIEEHGLPWTVRRRLMRSPVQAVELSQESRAHGDSPETRFPVALRTKAGPIEVEAPGTWEAAARVAETAAHFLRVSLRDGVRLETLRWEDLDRPAGEAVRREGACREAPPPSAPRSRVDERPEGLRVQIPRPGGNVLGPLLGLSLLVFLLWTLPVGLFGSVAFGLLPLAVVLAAALKAGLGYSAELDVSPRRVAIRTRGLLLSRSVEIPADELEDLIFLRPEWGGPRNVLAFMMDGFLVARSDRASARFGHGLERAELLWLQARILGVLAGRGPASRAQARRGPRGRNPPYADSVGPTLLGLLAGGIAGDGLGGVLGVAARLPFLEHVLNVGGLTGALLARLAFVEWRRIRSSSRPARSLLGGLAAVALLAVALAPGSPLVQHRPSFDEARLLREPTETGRGPAPLRFAGRPWPFWIGWSATLTAAGCVSAWALGWALWRRSSQARPPVAQRAGRPLLADPSSVARRVALSGVVAAGVALGFRFDRAGPGEDFFAGLSDALRPRQVSQVGIAPAGAVRQRIEERPGRAVALFFGAYARRDRWLLPGLARLARGYAGELEVIGAPLDVEGKGLRPLVQAYGSGLLHADGMAANAGWARDLLAPDPPGVLLLDASGAVAWGGQAGSRLDEAVATLLGPPRASAPLAGRDVPGQLVHAGQPFVTSLPQPLVKFQVYDTWSWRRVLSEAERERAQVDLASGAVQLRGLPPGAYSVSAVVWGHDGGWDDPFSGGAEFGVPEGGPVETVHIGLLRKLRLREPVDTHDRFEDVPTLAGGGRVRFAWDSAPTAEEYRWVLYRVGSDGKDQVAEQGSTAGPSLELDLGPGEQAFELSAWHGTEMVGRLQSRVAKTVSSRLRLRVP